MFNKIILITDNSAIVKVNNSQNITMNQYVILEDSSRRLLGEIVEIRDDSIKVDYLGEFVDNKFIGGVVIKPRMDSNVRIASEEEISIVLGSATQGFMKLGEVPFYENKSLYLDINKFFETSFALVGNNGTGKSCGVSTLIQNLFLEDSLNMANSNFIIFDVLGEYLSAFNSLGTNSQYKFKVISTNSNIGASPLIVPIYLLNAVDLGLLLRIYSGWQLSILEKMIKFAIIFSQDDASYTPYKNNIIAKTMLDVLYANELSYTKRNAILSILDCCITEQFSINTIISEGKSIGSCLAIDASGYMSDSPILMEYLKNFLNIDSNIAIPDIGYYKVADLEKYLNFTFISEGIYKDSDLSRDGVAIKRQLHELVIGKYAKYFECSEKMTPQSFISSIVSNGEVHCQVVNINLADVLESFAGSIIKIICRIIFEYTNNLSEKIPFHIIVEGADRYIYNSKMRELTGYDIFERIAKEGIKNGVVLGVVSERPSEIMSDVFSRCINVLAFREGNSLDIDAISRIAPSFNQSIVSKINNLQAGTCLAIGPAFRVPTIVRLRVPNSGLNSIKSNITSIWSGLKEEEEFVVPKTFTQVNEMGTMLEENTGSMADQSSGFASTLALATESIDASAGSVQNNQSVENIVPTVQDSQVNLVASQTEAVGVLDNPTSTAADVVTSAVPVSLEVATNQVIDVPSLPISQVPVVGKQSDVNVPMPNLPNGADTSGETSDIFTALAPAPADGSAAQVANGIPSDIVVEA